MAVSMRFLSQASKGFENLVSHAATPKALRTPKTPKTPLSPPTPLSPMSRLSFFPESRECPMLPKPAGRRVVHFADPAQGLSGNASSILGRIHAEKSPCSPSCGPDLRCAAATTRDAVLARRARQEDRTVTTPPVAAFKLELPSLLGRRALPQRAAEPLEVVDEESCAHAARKSFWEQQARRNSRAMVDFVV